MKLFTSRGDVQCYKIDQPFFIFDHLLTSDKTNITYVAGKDHKS